jgi:steroid delta-isomerase-like uncharacterized protein
MGLALTDQLSKQQTAMTPAEMNKLIEQHIAAETDGDTDGAVAMYTDDVIHDVVGAPHGALHGPDAAKGFYEFLTSNIATEQMDITNARYGEDHCVMEHQWTGTVPGEFLGIPGNGKRISFRVLHIWDFKDGVHLTRERLARRQRHRHPAHLLAKLSAGTNPNRANPATT